MSKSTESVKHEIHTRVDAPHAFDGMPVSEDPTADLLTSIAGTNPNKSASQLCNQAIELASHLRNKQSLLERRESELNARLALLDSEARATRMGSTSAPDDENHEATADSHVESFQRQVVDHGIALDQIDDEVAHQSGSDQISDHENTASLPFRDPATVTHQPSEAFVRRLRELESERENASPSASAASSDSQEAKLRSRGVPPRASKSERPHIQVAASSDADGKNDSTARWRQPTHEPADERHDPVRVQVSKLSDNAERVAPTELHNSLAVREAQLRERESQLQDTQDQVTELHRESIELRMATEQLWNEMCQELTEEEIAEQLAVYRAKLTDHFKMTNEETARRHESLLRLQQELADQEGQLRHQRMDVQLWIDRQRNELEARTGMLVARELEFARREAEFQRQNIVWQQQREEYRREIEQLSHRIRASA